jgi:class 3 adenylate cyclase
VTRVADLPPTPQEPRPSSASGRATARFVETAGPSTHLPQVLEEFLHRASLRGESAVALARAVLCALALVRMFIIYGEAMLRLEWKPWIASAGLIVGLLLSTLWVVFLRGRTRLRVGLQLSIVLDSCVFLCVLLPMVIWPHAKYAGALREPDMAALLLVVVAAGARLAPRAALVGTVTNLGALTLMLVVDHARNAAVIAYPWSDIALSYMFVAAAATLAYAIAKGTRLLVTEGAESVLKAERARQRLGIYVSEEVAAALDQGQGEPRLGGAVKEVAVLFSDLRGFTRFAERREPEQLVGELNAYLEAMVAAVRAEGGVIDKYIGDAIMVLFGVPTPRKDAAAAALRAAAAMQRAMIAHNAERARQGLPALAHGIGVHFGPCVWGNIGTRERMQYTVIGDAVNLASRLESATKEQRVGVLASQDALAAAMASGADFPRLERVAEITVKGREQALDVYTFEDAALR